MSKTNSEIDRVFMIEDDPDYGNVIGVTYQHSDDTCRTEWFPMDNIKAFKSLDVEDSSETLPEDVDINPMFEDRSDPEE